jgi:type VI secretion system protein ImpG
MDPRLLNYYNQELKFIREMGTEFAEAYPRIAARLGLEGGVECADPYIERLLEGFAFLSARTQLKLEARHPEFTQHLLELIYPHFLAPTPSCAIVEIVPDLKEGSLQAGLRVPRNTSMRPPLLKGERTACEFLSAHDVTLWPLTVTEARYITGAGALSTLGISGEPRARAAVRLRLKTAGGVAIKALPVDRLVFFIHAGADLAARIYEQILGNGIGVAMRALNAKSAQVQAAVSIRDVGFSDNEALLPVKRDSFNGYRLLQEYFALPERYLFFALTELAHAWHACTSDECEIFILLDRPQSALENQIDGSQFRLSCTPVINLFPRALDRIHINRFDTEHHLIPDRNRPGDFEIFALESVAGVKGSGEASIPVRPFYAADHGAAGVAGLYYTLQRRQTQPSSRRLQTGTRSTYVGSECYLSLTGNPALQEQILQLDARALCSNRDLPVLMGPGSARGDLLIEGGAAIAAVRSIVQPNYPRPSAAFGDTSWNLISHLSLNYLSLLNSGQTQDASLLRDMLSLYIDPTNPVSLRQVEGVRGINYEAVVRRLPLPGPISHGRGLRITLTMEDAAFEGTGVLLLAAVLERFFARYVSINSFTQTRVVSSTRGEVKEWPVRLGNRPLM